MKWANHTLGKPQNVKGYLHCPGQGCVVLCLCCYCRCVGIFQISSYLASFFSSFLHVSKIKRTFLLIYLGHRVSGMNVRINNNRVIYLVPLLLKYLL